MSALASRCACLHMVSSSVVSVSSHTAPGCSQLISRHISAASAKILLLSKIALAGTGGQGHLYIFGWGAHNSAQEKVGNEVGETGKAAKIGWSRPLLAYHVGTRETPKSGSQRPAAQRLLHNPAEYGRWPDAEEAGWAGCTVYFEGRMAGLASTWLELRNKADSG